MRFGNYESRLRPRDPFVQFSCLTLAAFVAVSDNDTATQCVVPNGSGRLGAGANNKGGND